MKKKNVPLICFDYISLSSYIPKFKAFSLRFPSPGANSTLCFNTSLFALKLLLDNDSVGGDYIVNLFLYAGETKYVSCTKLQSKPACNTYCYCLVSLNKTKSCQQSRMIIND